MPWAQSSRKVGPEVYVPLILLFTGSAIAVTTWLLRTSRFASIENRTEALGQTLYDELAPALPIERLLLVMGISIALIGALSLMVAAIRGRRNHQASTPSSSKPRI